MNDRLYQASVDATTLVVDALNGGEKLNNNTHKKRAKEASSKMRKEKDEEVKELLEKLGEQGGVKLKNRLDRMMECGEAPKYLGTMYLPVGQPDVQ